MAENGNGTGIGDSVKRTEDFRFLTGRGNYTADINLPRQTYACFVRSPHARAKINGIDTSAAKSADGVIAVFTGKDMADDGVNGLPCGWQVHSANGDPMKEPPHPPLVVDKALHVGDQVALVVAETLQQARDAAESIEVDYEEQEAVVNMEKALEGGALVHDDVPNNLCYDWALGEEKDIDEALDGSEHVIEIDIVNNRMIANAMEPRAAIGDYDVASDSHTLYTTSQNPHVIRLLMGAFVLSIPEHKLRVISPDVGGGFGSKIFHYAEEAIMTWAAKKVKRPVKWVADRTESFVSDAHGRDHITHAKLGVDSDGKFTALKVETKANMGAYLSTFSSSVPTYLYGTLLAGVYTTPKIFVNVKAVFTNTVPVDAYRGAGRPEATYVLERLVNKAATELGIDKVEIRRKNLITKDAFPYQTPVALQYDTGDYEASLDKALELSDYGGFEGRKKDSESRGKLRGIGISTYIEACGLAPSAVAGSLGARAGLYEAANVRVNPTGSVTVFTGSHAHGQGHETTFAQVVSDKLGIPYENIEIVHGDTGRVPFGMGTYGSRSQAVGGEAIVRAINKVIDKGSKIAAHLMEADAADVEFKDGTFSVKGTDKNVAFGDVALQAYVPHNFPHETLEPGLEEQAFYDPLNFTFPSGCHICEVEVDPDTGDVDVVAMTSVDDFGRVINPMIVEGQVKGGIAQGIGQALYEGAVYDDDGQLLTGSYMDYVMPRSKDIPEIKTDSTFTACTHNSLGAKGCGEAGAIGSPPAVINAVLDALSGLGVKDISMPASSHKVWEAIQAAKS